MRLLVFPVAEILDQSLPTRLQDGIALTSCSFFTFHTPAIYHRSFVFKRAFLNSLLSTISFVLIFTLWRHLLTSSFSIAISSKDMHNPDRPRYFASKMVQFFSVEKDNSIKLQTRGQSDVTECFQWTEYILTAHNDAKEHYKYKSSNWTSNDNWYADASFFFTAIARVSLIASMNRKGENVLINSIRNKLYENDNEKEIP